MYFHDTIIDILLTHSLIQEKNPEKVIQKCKFFNIAINNIEYTISQLVYIISSVAASVNLFKKSKMRDSSCFNNQHTQIKLTVSQTNLWMI